jgi:hypothetical protein
MESEATITRIAPYISFKTLRTFIEDVRQHGIPTRFDASALARFSGSVRPQLMSAARFLNLVDSDNKPLPALNMLVEATEPDQWKEALTKLINEAYEPIIALDLTKVTPGHLNQAFKEFFKAKEEVARKQVTFFIYAVKDAGMELSPRVLNKTRTSAPRRSVNTPRKKPEREQNGGSDTQDGMGGSAKEYKRQDSYDGMTRVPIPLGLDRVAYLHLPDKWDKKELKRLLAIIKLSLGDDEDIPQEKLG